MTEELFRNDSYLKELDVIISDITPEGLIFDKTIFYPEGGGQPGDEGFVTSDENKTRILGTKYINQKLVHLVEETQDFKKNDKVKLELDWSRRYSHMQVHTCLHLLCSIIPYPVTGGSIGDGRGRLDFDLETKPNKEDVLNSLNELICDDHTISISSITDDELDQNPNLVRTMSVKPPRGSGTIRMIKIGEDIDFQPCGGTHVKKTSEIKLVKSVKIENKGKMNKRIIVNF
ncbi:alanyl-tRNA editing protein [Alphaproteobacteria bacterium]|nr:alanyl-tRNA editing protein [Alphaproteobacteria bacterium]MDB3916672.1 alanyl-tRNA editing protein [Alphaproteobacteria bacterium]